MLALQILLANVICMVSSSILCTMLDIDCSQTTPLMMWDASTLEEAIVSSGLFPALSENCSVSSVTQCVAFAYSKQHFGMLYYQGIWFLKTPSQ